MKQLICLGFLALSIPSWTQVSLKYEQGYSLDRKETVQAFQEVAERCLKCELKEIGYGDNGSPIHLFTAGSMSPELPTVLINNAIHAGESCGVEASLLLLNKLIAEDSPVLDKVNLAIIPMYNVGGAENRSCCTRANQLGPLEQGFRGNGRHLDLNRDFMKADSRNVKAFYSAFHELDPELFIDTHTSNGADYPYTMTLISSQADMLESSLSQAHYEGIVPAIYKNMEDHYPMVPYVDLIADVPDSGIIQFPDLPRYSNGYVGLFHCFGFTSEAHMLKPYADRVRATFHLLDEVMQHAAFHGQELVMLKKRAEKKDRKRQKMPLQYELDWSRKDSIWFRGFQAKYEESRVTGLKRLKYDQSKLWEDYIPYYHHYKVVDEVEIPEFYIVPQAWHEVLDRLRLNGVQVEEILSDTLLEVEAYYIESFDTVDEPYEGHYLHRNIKTRSERQQIQFRAGDFLVPTRQKGLRYIMQALEPRAKDSFFAWGFFDSVLQQKEWFSPYVFEEMAEEILEQDENLQRDFSQRKQEDSEFAQNMWAQLIYIYRRSEYYEEEHRRYPVFRR